MSAPAATFAVRQVKFNGEISPTLYGDVSNPKVVISLRTCKNWLPIQNGALVKWPGTKFVGLTKFGPNAPCRLIRFVFSDQQAFVLEVGDRYIRFWQNSQYVGVDGNLHFFGDGYVGGHYEVATVFTSSNIQYLKFAQVGNTITFSAGNQAGVSGGVNGRQPQDLVHTSGALTPWTISATPTKIPIASVPDALTVGINAWSNVVIYKAGDFATQNNVLWISIQGNNLNNSPPAPAINAATDRLTGTVFWNPAIDTAHPAVTVDWVTTGVVQDPNGVTYETGPSAVLTGTGPLSSDRQPPLAIPSTFTPALPAGWTLLYLKLYRATHGGSFGFVKIVNSTPVPDDGRTPDFAQQPPKATDPFLVNGADLYPTIVSYLDQRRIFAGGAGLPNGLSLSRDGDFYNWDALNVPGADTDSINLLLASEVLEQVRSFVPLARGVCLTGQGEFTISGVNGGALSRSSRSAIRQSKWGSSWLNPIVIGKGLLFNTAQNNQVRDFYPLYGLYNDVWDGQDLTVAARHLFDNYTLSDWSFQSAPYPVIRAVRSDGSLICLTYQHAPPSFGTTLTEGVAAWSRRATGVGYDAYRSTCTVPEPPEDAVYYVTTRIVGGAAVSMIEREASPILPFVPALYAPAQAPTANVPGSTGVALPDARYGVFLDAALQFDGHVDPTVANNRGKIDSVLNPGSVNPTDYLVGAQVKFQTNGSNLFVNTDPGQTNVVLDPENVNGLGTVTLRVVGYVSATQVVCEILDSNMTQAQLSFLWAVGAGALNAYWAIGRTTYTVAHLSGYQLDSGVKDGVRGVWALADGGQVDPGSVGWAGGVLTLPAPAVVVCVGIAYNADAELLDAFNPNKELRNLKKTLIRMGFEVTLSRDLWVGRDFANLRQWAQKTVASSWTMPLSTGYFEVSVDGSSNKDGRAAIRHFTPLPAILTSVLREYELGGT